MRWVRSSAAEHDAPSGEGRSTLLIEPLPESPEAAPGPAGSAAPLAGAPLAAPDEPASPEEPEHAEGPVADTGGPRPGRVVRSLRPGRRGGPKPPSYGAVAGLVISARRVRVCHGEPGRNLRTGEIDLPEGTVVEGELRDPAALARAVRELWRTARIPTRRVALALANHDIVSRSVTLPPLSRKDMRSALRFELVENIPFPVEESIFDLQVIGTEAGEDSEREQVRVLAVAALADMCQSYAAALRAAKLQPKGIDYRGFSLVRAVAATSPTEAVECVVEPGDGALTIAVHQRGTVRFARTVLTHNLGSSVSGEIEDQLSSIERFRQGAAGPQSASGGRINPLAMRGDPLAEAVRATIEYYGTQSGAAAIERIAVVGGGEEAQNLATYLNRAVGVPTGLLSPLDPRPLWRNVDDDHDPDTQRAAAADGSSTTGGLDGYTVPYGVTLQVGGEVPGPVPLALLPERPDARGLKRTVLTAAAGALTAALVLMGVLSVAGPDVDSATADTQTVEMQRGTLESQLAALDEVRAASREHRRLEDLEADLRDQQVDWNRLVGKVREVAPSGVEVLAIEGSAPIKDRRDSVPGVLEVRGTAADQLAISSYLSNLGDIDGLVRPWLMSVTAEVDAGPEGRLTFGLKAELDKSALVVDPQEGTR